MVTVLVNPIDVWSKRIEYDMLSRPVYGMVDKNGEIKARVMMNWFRDGSIKFAVKGEKSGCIFSADWKPPDDKMENALFLFFEQLIAGLNLSYRGEWNENHIQKRQR